MAHFEMICAIVYQLTRNLTPEEIKESGFDKYYVDHTLALWPQAAGGIPFNACEFQSKGDVITDLVEDMAADAALCHAQQNCQKPFTLYYEKYLTQRITKNIMVCRCEKRCAYGKRGRPKIGCCQRTYCDFKDV